MEVAGRINPPPPKAEHLHTW